MSFESLVLLRLICVCCVIANSSNSWLEGTGQQGKQHLQSSDPDIKKEVFIYLKKKHSLSVIYGIYEDAQCK